MKKWKYTRRPIIKTLKHDKYIRLADPKKMIDADELGEDGWELVSVDKGIAYFKRPIEGD